MISPITRRAVLGTGLAATALTRPARATRAELPPIRIGVLTDMAGVYAANFTAQELRDMTAFYRSPTGQKVLRLLPTVAQQSMRVGQAYGHRIGEEIKQRVIEEMRKKGHDI